MIFFFNFSCFSGKRDAQSATELKISITHNAGLMNMERKLFPVLYCSDSVGSQTLYGLFSNFPRKEFIFNLDGVRPLFGKQNCYLDVYTDDTSNLKLSSTEPKVIQGDQYSLLYQTTTRLFTDKKSILNPVQTQRFSYEKLFEKIEIDKEFLFSFNSVRSETVRFYCKETEVLTPRQNFGPTFFFALKISQIYGTSEFLTDCVLKDPSTEKKLETNMPPKISLGELNEKQYAVQFSKQETEKSVASGDLPDVRKIPDTPDDQKRPNDERTVDTPVENPAKASQTTEASDAVYGEFESGVFFFLSGGCKHGLEFKGAGSQARFRSFLLSGQGCSTYDTGFLTYKIFDSHVELPSLVNAENLLFSFFYKDGTNTYSIIRPTSEGFEKIGGKIKKIEFLKEIEDKIVFYRQ